jgi:GT2 family glycosyltransferase
VPVYNAVAYLERCLASLAASRYQDFDVLVVDDGSTDPVEPAVARRGFRTVRIDGPGGPARARNRGVAHVRGRYVVFIDADVCVHEDTLGQFSDVFAGDPMIDAVIGCYDDAPAAPGFVSAYKNLFHHYVHRISDGPVSTFWAGCGAMRRELFVAFGGFDERRYGRPTIEDIELGTRLSLAGHRIVLDRRVQCTHLKRWTLGNLIKTDVFDRGIPWTRLMLRVGAVPDTLNVKPLQRVCVALAYLTALTMASALWFPAAWVAAVLLICVVTALNRDFYRYMASKRGWWFALRVIPLHWLYFGYCGICFVAGAALYYARDARRDVSGD